MVNLQGYDIPIPTGNMRPAKAGTDKIVIPISYSTIGIIENLEKLDQSISWTFADKAISSFCQQADRPR